MTRTQTGAVIGAVLGLTWVAFGFWPAVLVGVLIAVGAGVGRVLDGRLDLRALVDVVRGGRSSS